MYERQECSVKLFRYPRVQKPYLDVIKLIAIGMVVFNHSGNNGYRMYVDVMTQPAHHLLLFYSAFIKIAVPLFFMSSGALLLKKEEPYMRILTKRVLRFTGILLAVTLFFYWQSLKASEVFSVKDFLIHLYKNDLTGHLWYLYSYICFLLLLPFLRKLANLMRKQDYLLMMVVYLIAQLLPIADYALFQGSGAHTSYISFFMAEIYVVYPLLGYYIDNRSEKDEREETIYILVFLSILSLFATCLLMDGRYQMDGGWTNSNKEAYMGRLSLIPAVTLFYGVKKLFDQHPVKEKIARLLFVLGSCTFGVYLFDPKWRQFTQDVRTLLTPTLGLYFSTHVQTICACVLGLFVTFLFKCIVSCIGQLYRKILPHKDQTV